ncbi:MAG: isochorismatase family protein [Chlamydiales bacterium]|nr:isochorismatase family protein [Chlamydiia bacterium]MCP5506761.1 isochorismatase family protein [Chlamydiales bacterium]
MAYPFLKRESTGLLVIDVQDRLFAHVERNCETLIAMQKAVQGFNLMHLPIVVTEQYPEKMGSTVKGLQPFLENASEPLSKTTFSCLADAAIRKKLLDMPITQWVLIGIEAHVCVLQTARELKDAGKDVVVLNDAITSRSIYDYSTAIAEMRDCGIRISSVETVLFELMRDSKAPEFKELSALIK